ncbi:MAG: sigma-70 family RNA polymerase sigma factor [Actinomycetota bacterium]
MERLYREDPIRMGRRSMQWDSELSAFCGDEHPRLVGALSLYCGDHALAEELAQDALARACRDWSKVRRLTSPGAWVHRVAINLANSYFRRRAAETRAKHRLEGRRNPSGGEGLDRAAALTIRSAVASLPRRQRTALILRYFVDLPVREVAVVMECPEGTVKTLTSKAIASLRVGLPVVEMKEVRDAD